MENTEQKLVEYIKEKYKPEAIILHGSRANGHAREHSDWDMLLILSGTEKPRREIVYGANVEYACIFLPLIKGKSANFAFRSENTKILFDPNNIAQSVIDESDEYTQKGNSFTEADKAARHAYLVSSLNGIADYKDNPLILFNKKSDFMSRVTPAWFGIYKNAFQPSGYVAFPIIHKEDPELFDLIERFILATESESLVETGNKILLKLFPEIYTNNL